MTEEQLNQKAEEYINTMPDWYGLYDKAEMIEAYKAGYAAAQPEIEKLKEALQQCAEVVNLFASRAGIQTEDAPLKSDASDDFGALSALRAAREALTTTPTR